MAHKFKENEEKGMEVQNLEDIDDNQEITKEDGEVTTIAKEAEKNKMSITGFREALSRAVGKDIIEKFKNVDEVLSNDFKNPTNRN